MTRSLSYFTDVALRRHEGAVVIRHADHTVIRSPHNPNFYWGNFLLLDDPPTPATLPEWEAAFHSALPEAAHIALGVRQSMAETEHADHFRDRGYEVFHDTILTAEHTHAPRTLNRDVPLRAPLTDADWDALLNLRLTVNAADPAGHEADSYRTFAAAKLASSRRMQEGGHGTLLAAFDDHGNALSSLGIFDCGEGIARYQSVETHPDHRSRGLAGTLVHTAAQWAQATFGTRTLVIVADPGYHAQRLYESVGFTPTETQFGLQKRPAE